MLTCKENLGMSVYILRVEVFNTLVSSCFKQFSICYTTFSISSDNFYFLIPQLEILTVLIKQDNIQRLSNLV